MHPFFTPWKYQKTVRFSDVFKGLIEKYLGPCQIAVMDHFELTIFVKRFNLGIRQGPKYAFGQY